MPVRTPAPATRRGARVVSCRYKFVVLCPMGAFIANWTMLLVEYHSALWTAFKRLQVTSLNRAHAELPVHSLAPLATFPHRSAFVLSLALKVYAMNHRFPDWENEQLPGWGSSKASLPSSVPARSLS